MSVKKVIVVSLLALVGLAAVAVVGGAVYLRRYSRYAPYLSATSNIAIAQKLDANVRNRSDYTPPHQGHVTDDQIARFVKVEERVESAVRTRSAAFQTACEALESNGGENRLRVMAALKAIGGIGSAFLDAKRAHVDALNDAGFSLHEYEWIRRHLYAAAEIDLAQLELQDLASFSTVDDPVSIRRRTPPQVAPETRQLVERHTAALRRWRRFAFFGM